MAKAQNASGSAQTTHHVAGDTLIFALGFTVFLALALFGQLLGWHWRSSLPGAEGATSIFGGVKAAVYTFMSHLT